MLERIVSIFQEHKNKVMDSQAAYAKAMEEIKIYNDEIHNRKAIELQNMVDNTYVESRRESIEKYEAVLDEISEKAKAAVSSPVSPDFIATLEAIKAVKDLTPADVEAAIGPYKDNYLSYRAICEAVGGAVKGFAPITLEEVQESIKEIRRLCFKAINEYIDSYYFNLVLSPTNEAFSRYDAMLSAFCDRRFEDAAAVRQSARDTDTTGMRQ